MNKNLTSVFVFLYSLKTAFNPTLFPNSLHDLFISTYEVRTFPMLCHVRKFVFIAFTQSLKLVGISVTMLSNLNSLPFKMVIVLKYSPVILSLQASERYLHFQIRENLIVKLWLLDSVTNDFIVSLQKFSI
jgi:hypothetical protein